MLEIRKQAPGLQLVHVGKSSHPQHDQIVDSMNSGMKSESNAAIQSPINLDIDLNPMMDGMNYSTEEKQLYDLYVDIYRHDPICGGVVDMYANLPFSSATLSGADDKYLEHYQAVLERLNLADLCGQISTDQFVTSSWTGNLIYNERKKVIEDLMVHKSKNLTIHEMPLYTQDPIIKAKSDPALVRTLGLESKRIDSLRKRLGDEIFTQMQSGSEYELDPLTTVHLPRSAGMNGKKGTSLYRRILPIFLVEKNLYRGTLVESARRQRGLLHIQLGDGADWLPTDQDLEDAMRLFQTADADPLGAIVATRLGVNLGEYRQGGDFWKIMDVWDQTTPFKLRAMGFSEAFLSGDAQFNNTDGSLQVFNEMMVAQRNMVTRNFIYNKLFALISMMNGFAYKRGRVLQRESLMPSDPDAALRKMNDGSKLFIPTLHWEKQLKPKNDASFMEMMQQLQQMGIPIPLRAIAAAGGLNLENILRQQEDDLSIQRRIGAYNKRLASLKGGEEEGGGGFGSFSSALSKGRVSMQDRGKMIDPEITGLTRTGKKKMIVDQKAANHRANKNILKAVKELARKGNTSLTRGQRINPYASKNSFNL